MSTHRLVVFEDFGRHCFLFLDHGINPMQHDFATQDRRGESVGGDPGAQSTTAARRLFCADNLLVLRAMATCSIDLVYMDPPFNTNRRFVGSKGSPAAGAGFDDVFGTRTEDKEDHANLIHMYPEIERFLSLATHWGHKGSGQYLLFMAVRLIEVRRVLRETGALYLHCDSTMAHYLKILLDGIFGVEHLRNEIIWCYTGPQPSRQWYPRKHDNLFYVAKSASHFFDGDAVRIPSQWNALGGFGNPDVPKKNRGKVPEDWWHMTFGPNSKERVGYPTQKPLALLHRIIAASSREGETVLDPFCGSATTLLAAEALGRNWIGIDVSPRIHDILTMRLSQAGYPPSFDYQNMHAGDHAKG